MTIQEIINDLINFTRKHPDKVTETLVFNFVDEKFDVSAVPYKYYKRLRKKQIMETRIKKSLKKIEIEEKKITKIESDLKNLNEQVLVETNDLKTFDEFVTIERNRIIELETRIMTMEEEKEKLNEDLIYYQRQVQLRDFPKIFETTKKDDEMHPNNNDEKHDFVVSTESGNGKGEELGPHVVNQDKIIIQIPVMKEINISIPVTIENEEYKRQIMTCKELIKEEKSDMSVEKVVTRYFFVEKKMVNLMDDIFKIVKDELGDKLFEAIKRCRETKGRAESILRTFNCLVMMNYFLRDVIHNRVTDRSRSIIDRCLKYVNTGKMD
jgi:hypothetical protein